jgi:hypothetical protein
LKAPIPWLRVFVEGVVIVGSILLAFRACVARHVVVQNFFEELKERVPN